MDFTTWYVIVQTALILLVDLAFVIHGYRKTEKLDLAVKWTISDHMAKWGKYRYHLVVWAWLFLTFHFWGDMWLKAIFGHNPLSLLTASHIWVKIP